MSGDAAAGGAGPEASSGSRVHRYSARCRWRGSTAAGYEAYDRDHEVELEGVGPHLKLSADAAFHGRPNRANPEQLLLAATASCQLLEFLSLAARARIEVRSYEDSAEAVMPEDDPPVRITRIRLRPRIEVAAGTSRQRVLQLVALAHRGCYIANSVSAEVELDPEIVESPI